MRERVARTKTEKTAWKLIERLTKAMPWMVFVIVLRAPDTGFEVVPVTPVHPLDKELIAQTIAEFAKNPED